MLEREHIPDFLLFAHLNHFHYLFHDTSNQI